jgi:hemoglobin/transferrin/lactoferrin receptor protein
MLLDLARHSMPTEPDMNKQRKHDMKKLIILAVAIQPCVGNSAEITKLKDLTIIGYGAAKDQFNLPYSTDSISDERAINELQIKTLPDVLKYEPGVMLQQSGVAQTAPYIRGFTGYRTLLMVDGIRLNNATFRDGPNQYWGTVDPLMIDRYDLIRGSNSALYGSDSIGGTLNVKTQSWQPRDDGSNFGGRVYYRFNSADLSNTGRVELGGSHGNWDAILGGSGKVYQNLTTGDDQNNPKTGYDNQSVNTKVRYHLNDTDKLTFAYQYDTTNDAWRTHSTIYGVPFNGTVPGNKLARVLDQRRQLAYGRYEASNLAFMKNFEFTISHQQMDEEQLETSSKAVANQLNFKDGTLGITARADSNTPIGNLAYGVEYYHDTVTSRGTKFDPSTGITQLQRQGTVADGSSYDQAGVYLQDTIKWNKFEFTGGGRYNYASVHLGKGFNDATGLNVDNFNNSWDTVVGNFKAIFNATKNVNVFAGVSQGWKSPNVYDLSGEEWTRSGEVQTYSLGLKPEHFLTYEVGFKTRYKHFDSSATYFYTDINNMIERAPTGQVFEGDTVVEGRNSGKGHIHGIELSSKIFITDEWSTFANFTWMEGTVSQYATAAPVLTNAPMTRIMPITGNVGIHWADIGNRFWAESSVIVAGKQSRLSYSDRNDISRVVPGGTPGYVDVGIRGGWNLNNQLKMTIAGENLTDAAYRNHGSGINNPGRRVVLSMDYRF